MVNGICGVAEAAMECAIAVVYFMHMGAQGKTARNRQGNLWKIMSAMAVLICFVLEANAHSTAIQSLIHTMFVLLPMMAAGLVILARGEFLHALAWSIFFCGTILLVRMPVVLVCAVRYGLSYAECAAGSYEWANLWILLFYIPIFWVCMRKRSGIADFLKSVPFQNIVLAIIGMAETVIVLYVMNVDWKGEDGKKAVLLGIALMLFLFLVCISVSFVIVLEYREIVKANHMLRANEAKMKRNYDMLASEIAKNRKAAHDRRHDMEYVYECIRGQECEKGLRYIERISALYENMYRNHTWTGYGTVDYLINKAVCRCRENDVGITSDIELTAIPIEEYDFFTVLANLLDNAVDAALKCSGEKRYINFCLKSFHNNLAIYVSNGYRDAPRTEGERFLSDKTEDKNHGWGVECVREVVRKYDGMIDIDYHDGKFMVDIMFIG